MLFRFPKLFVAAVLLMALWGLSRLRSSGEDAWVRVSGSIPGRVRILLFQASVGSLTEGQKAQLCYGVANAKSVRIAPVAVRVYPSANRCVEIVPQHTTHYTILAEGFDGSVATKSFTLPVQAAPGEPEQRVQFAGLRVSEKLPAATITAPAARK
jgi:hypothetical protein